MKRFSILLLLLLLLPACGQGGPSTQLTQYPIYFASTSANRNLIHYEYFTPASGQTAFSAALSYQFQAPLSADLYSPFPLGTQLLSWTLSDGVLTLDLSEAYGDLGGIDLTTADYCLVMTFCQFPGVDSVRITVAGRQLPALERQLLSPEDVFFWEDLLP